MSKGGGKPPSRMTRKHSFGPPPVPQPWDPKEAYTTEQLAEFGAVILLWNEVEAFLDLLIYTALDQPIWDVSRHLRGVPQRIKLLRGASNRNKILSDDAKKMIKTTLDGVEEYEGLRNKIAHSMPYDIDKGIAYSYTYDTDMAQTIVTLPALNGLYLRLKMLIYELREVHVLFLFSHPDEQKRPYRLLIRDRRVLPGPQDVQERALGALRLQKKRLSLPPLPEFSDEPPTPPTTEAPPSHPD